MANDKWQLYKPPVLYVSDAFLICNAASPRNGSARIECRPALQRSNIFRNSDALS
jgi:hypothetical protein